MRKTNRPSGVFKTENSYQKMINPQLYERIPKAVLAALVVDLILIRSEENFSIINKSIIEEWQVLYNNGIVPQKPPKI